jgi:hypothetical protein
MVVTVGFRQVMWFVISLYDILCELPEPHGARGATLCEKP